ncbi:MAG: hypothetical protein A2653_00635 [Candidatus Zambryskibacteria bacterium RIFCSPHIGHO2_01_FULL_43_25]|uniref:Uncharacterized protein n=1 Tax=Candidatus Zambryskibacteria bacterium RIFCSPLOWO2_01_FULL_45_21 TaxID=1802761 RepID=A0A1G2U4I8_9BACT|nr:MAG: hypothetical protein A2653_00635 [Candidatus Zambryskibacteria bacterium RIFCSPHIGHO2_01_FULL_43_25]OHB00818.1 MAG: hypothetical protein A3E94_00360 [Candidatus Zambryskibacteria bacterium RIFCSPHIGHO2_12_FULL_44_12b]OHB04413.1 MAG: hypothetical protein A3B14_03160 [Candidatus Zambryskibacteria bacterium RIFCSPLOWO2_01_FULL_45_21]
MGKEDRTTFGQANHVLTLISQHNPSAADLDIICDGYITDLVMAAKARTLPVRDKFREACGLVKLAPIPLPPLLIPRGTVTVTLKERHNPDEFYRTRSGLFVQPDFRAGVIAEANPSEAGESFNLKYADLGRDASDSEIEEVLGKSHFFGETQVCAIVADFIAKQQNGEDGTLLNGGRANLFYTGSCVVDVHWYAGRGWRVVVWSRGGDEWRAGRRVFSPAPKQA